MSAITRFADKVIPGWDKVSAKRLWFEIFLIASTYWAYSNVRNNYGSQAVSPQEAAANADRVIDIEKAVGLYWEADIQMFFSDNITFLQFWNIFYGALHFAMAYVVMVFLFLRFPEKYRFWRRTLGVTTLIGLYIYTIYPLMPPRLMGACTEYGACRADSPFVDTLITAGGFWNFETRAVAALSNQYAAMPSLHFAWALWVGLAATPQLRKRYTKLIFGAYPALMGFAIVVTGNHFIIDGIAGAAVLGLGYAICLGWEQVTQKRRAQKATAHDSGSDDLATSVEAGATQSDHRAS